MKRLVLVAVTATTMLMAVPPVEAESFSCSASPYAPIETAIGNGVILVPLIQVGETVSCSRPAAIAMRVRPEIRAHTWPWDVWAPAGPTASGSPKTLDTQARLDVWYTCARGYFRTEGRVTGADYVTGPAVSVDDGVSGGASVDCAVKVQVTPPSP